MDEATREQFVTILAAQYRTAREATTAYEAAKRNVGPDRHERLLYTGRSSAEETGILSGIAVAVREAFGEATWHAIRREAVAQSFSGNQQEG